MHGITQNYDHNITRMYTDSFDHHNALSDMKEDASLCVTCMLSESCEKLFFCPYCSTYTKPAINCFLPFPNYQIDPERQMRRRRRVLSCSTCA